MQKHALKSWFQFFLGLLAIYFFIAVVLPFLSNLPLSKKAIETIEERDIDPRALFYTESEHAVEAGREMEELKLKNEGTEKENIVQTEYGH